LNVHSVTGATLVCELSAVLAILHTAVSNRRFWLSEFYANHELLAARKLVSVCLGRRIENEWLYEDHSEFLDIYQILIINTDAAVW